MVLRSARHARPAGSGAPCLGRIALRSAPCVPLRHDGAMLPPEPDNPFNSSPNSSLPEPAWSPVPCTSQCRIHYHSPPFLRTFASPAPFIPLSCPVSIVHPHVLIGQRSLPGQSLFLWPLPGRPYRLQIKMGSGGRRHTLITTLSGTCLRLHLLRAKVGAVKRTRRVARPQKFCHQETVGLTRFLNNRATAFTSPTALWCTIAFSTN